MSTWPLLSWAAAWHPTSGRALEPVEADTSVSNKDVDGVTRHSFAAMALNEIGFHSCTPCGILRLLDAYEIGPTHQADAVVVGRSPIPGKPVKMLLPARNATSTYCHSHIRDLADHVREAHIAIAAVGRPETIRGEWIKDGAVAIDSGCNPGNVDYTGAAARARLLSPVPCRVGPMTIAVLLSRPSQRSPQTTLSSCNDLAR